MKKSLKVWIVLFLLTLPGTAFARDWKAGLMIGAGVLSVDDPAGSTEIKTALSFLNGIVTLPARRDTRILTHLFYQDFDLNNTSNQVAGSVKSVGLNTSYQWRLRISRDWKPWIGAGLGFSQDKLTHRAKLDGQGFVIQRFDDREDSAINLLLNASTILKQWKMFDFGVHGQIDYPISGDITRFSIFGTVLF